MSKQRLIVLFDGTWNDPEDKTNVYRLCKTIKDYDGDDWLARRYKEGDEIWIFGFSRGAYTARSLVGLIRKCGLLYVSTPQLLSDAEELYRNKNDHPDSKQCKEFRENFSREVKIHFIGVWDTVGALGIPGTFISEKGLYSWHDTQLSKIVEYAYQAAALDENRAAYNIALWTTPTGEPKNENLEVEQRWFVGAHADVGGGYGDDPLSDLPLFWLQEKAREAGLKLDIIQADENSWKAKPCDSFTQFLHGGYALFRKMFHKGDGRFYRNYSIGQNGEQAVNVTVDPSVWKHWGIDVKYRPQTLTNAGLSPTSH